ncbi:hypothetical protein DFH09DRAFT_1191008 [Mycena vulgaris]|nr:hypothetical protein DFH09DRAFT_1191008 [Mycena vulgaris]
MAQFLRQSRGEPEPEGGDEPEKEAGPSDDQDQSSTVFLEDIETYRAYFDATAKCGVFDLSIQDKSLRPGYIGLHPLPAFRRILAAYDRNRISGDDTIDYTTGGRIQFSSWFRQLPRMIAANSMGAMMFQESEPNFINPSRVSPLRLSTQGSAGSSTTQRLHVNGRIAVCVTPVCVTESHVVVPRKIGLKSDRRRKWISGVPHDQDWERMEALLCLLFHETIMYGQIADKSLSFQTMISPETAKQSDSTPDRFTRGVPSSMFSARSPAKNSPGSSFQASKAKTLLAFDDTIPVYDARKTVIDFDADLDRLGHVLPLFIGEVPNGSFAIIGYSVSSYFGNILSKANKVPYIGMNLLWVIVCGVPA